MEKHPVKVCMISCLHGLYDDRIYWKEALSLKKHGYDVTHIGISEAAYDKISEHGIRLISIKRIRYFKNPYIDIFYRLLTFKKSYYKKILLTAKNLESDVYHFHDYQINRIGKKLKNLPHKPQLIYDVHEPYPEIERYLNRSKGLTKLFHIIFSIYIDKLQRGASRNYDAIIATEETVASYFRSFMEHKKVKIIYNYCDFKPVEHTENIQKEYDLIYIGGISQWRGIYELLNTAILIRKLNLKLKILFIGHIKERGLKSSIHDIIKHEKLNEIFYLKGSVPRTELVQYLQKSKIGVCIFKNNPVYHIILPIKIFEYLAFGLPVLVNNFGHSQRIISAENAGISVPETTPENILNSALRILENDAIYKEYSNNALRSVKKYTWNIMEKELLDIYSKLC